MLATGFPVQILTPPAGEAALAAYGSPLPAETKRLCQEKQRSKRGGHTLMPRVGKLIALSLAVLVGAAPAVAQAPPQIQTALEFLLGWGKGNWQAVKVQAAGKLTVKVGGTDYTLDAPAGKAEVQLVFPFGGLSTVRVEGKVKGVTVEEITVKAGGTEKKGKGTLTLEEKDGKFTVTSVAVE